MYSVRRRLLIALAAGFALLIIGIGLYIDGILGDRATEEFDAALVTKARAIAALTEQEEGQIEFDYRPDFMPEYERDDRPAYFQFWLGDGTPLMRSARLTEDLPHSSAALDAPRIRDLALVDGRAGRAVELHYVPEPPDDEDDAKTPADLEPLSVVLVVARDRERLDALISSMRWAIGGGAVVAILLALLLAWRTVATGFAPLDSIASQVKGLDAESLSTRIDLSPKPVELAPIVDQLNALLDRLDESFDRERRFAGNVAHELRTPLAELHSLAAVGARWPDDRDAVVRFFEDVGDIAGRMERVIADLLLLARCHAGVERVHAVPTDLRELVRTTWDKLAPAAEAASLTLNSGVPSHLVVDTDSGKLDLMLTNLLGNAISYSHAGTEVACCGHIKSGRFVLEIRNVADRLAPEDLKRLVEPFWRKDAARASSGHAGLGLALVKALADLLRIRLSFGQGGDGVFFVRLTGRAKRPGPAQPAPASPLPRDPQLRLRLASTIRSEGDDS